MAKTRRDILNEIVREVGLKICWDEFQAILTFARLLKVYEEFSSYIHASSASLVSERS